MREVLITSTVLIAALLLLRRIFRKSLSRWVQYALWGLVLLDVWPELRPWSASCSVWNPYAKCLTVWDATEYDGEADADRNWTRTLYFDGENLLAYTG